MLILTKYLILCTLNFILILTISLQSSMFFPKLHTLFIILCIKWDSTSSFFFAEAVSHGCYWFHWKFMIWILSLNINNSIVIFFIFINIRRTRRLIFSRDLGFAVQNDIKIGSSIYSWHWLPIKPSFQNRKFILRSSNISCFQVLLIFRSYF